MTEGRLIGGRFEVIAPLAEGGMGAVFLVRHVGVGRRFALKRIRPERASHPEALARFQREAAAGAIEHENVVAVIDSGTDDDGSPYLVMEYLEGENLASLIARTGPLPARRAVDIGVQIARGLAAAHAHGLVHRDLKPSNVFVMRREDGHDHVKVLDFGVAKIDAADAGADACALTATGAPIGSPRYMAPEQARGAESADARADIFSLGAVLYEMLGGAHAHPGVSYNEIVFHVMSRKPDVLSELRGDLPSELCAVVEKALEKEASARFATVRDLEQALLASLEPGAAASARWETTVDEGSDVGRVGDKRRPERSRRRRYAAAALGLGVALVAVVGLSFAWRARPPLATSLEQRVAVAPNSPSSPTGEGAPARPASTVTVHDAPSSPPAVLSAATRSRDRDPPRPAPKPTPLTRQAVEFDRDNPYER